MFGHKEIVHQSQTTEILFIEDAEDFQYYLVIYQSDEEVYREAFNIQILHKENTEQGYKFSNTKMFPLIDCLTSGTGCYYF